MATDVSKTHQQIPQNTSIPSADSALPTSTPTENGYGRQQEKEYLKEKDTVQTSTGRQQRRWEPLGIIFSGAVAILALVFSYIGINQQQVSIEEGRQLAYDSATQQIIHDQYELCRGLDQLRVEHPELSHLLSLPTTDSKAPWKNYRDSKQRIRSLLSEGKDAITVAERDKFFLQEQAVALHVFDIYEQTVYQWLAAAAVKDDHRAEILKMLVDYYEGRMLRNPRLRYHWDHGGSDMVEANPTRKRYDQYVRIDPKETDSRYPKDFVDEDSPLDAPFSLSP